MDGGCATTHGPQSYVLHPFMWGDHALSVAESFVKRAAVEENPLRNRRAGLGWLMSGRRGIETARRPPFGQVANFRAPVRNRDGASPGVVGAGVRGLWLAVFFITVDDPSPLPPALLN